jgi:hypothetical protein
MMRRVAVLVVALSGFVPCVLAQRRPNGGPSRAPRSEIDDDKACCQRLSDDLQDKSWIISRLL